jgi:signal transduction histidine kinase
VPIRRGSVVLGSLYLTNKEGGGEFTEEDQLAVEALGAYSAIAVYNLQMLSRQRSLVSGLIAAQEEERRAVAYDLHDGLTQYVMASHAHLEAFKHAHQSGSRERADRELSQCTGYLKEAVIESRRLVNGLRLLALDDLGLAGALEQLLNEEKERAGWQNAEFAHNVADRRFDKVLETAVYRIAQEALTNSRKHANSDRVRLTLLERHEPHSKSGALTLEIRDWGLGFVPELKIGEEGRVGLQGIVERSNLLGAEHEIISRPGGGAVVRARFPVLDEQRGN